MKFSQVSPNASPALIDYLMGVTSANIDFRVTIQNLVALMMKTSQLNSPYKFSVYMSGSPGVGGSTWTKAPLDTKQFDTGANFDATTNYRFVVPVTGYYWISHSIQLTLSGASNTVALQGALYKNGTALTYDTSVIASGNTNTTPRAAGADLHYLVAGDYLEVYGFIGEGGRGFGGGSANTRMTGFLASIS